ncbi:Inner membrane protein yebE [Citrobacter freundii]|nr:Inner membrane protein yebE [Citrobacter freundii]
MGGGAVAGTVLWNKYKDKVRAAHQGEPQFGAQSSPLDERTERLILALVFAAKSDGHIDAKNAPPLSSSSVKLAWKSRAALLLNAPSNNR